jgi:hypothetical protein
MKKLYTVTITYSAVVFAESEADAMEYSDILDEIPMTEAEELTQLPPGWSIHSLVYHEGHHDLTVAQAMKL